MSDVIAVGDAVFRLSMRPANPISKESDGYLTIMTPCVLGDEAQFPAKSITIYVGSGNLSELATWLEAASNKLLGKEAGE